MEHTCVHAAGSKTALWWYILTPTSSIDRHSFDTMTMPRSWGRSSRLQESCCDLVNFPNKSQLYHSMKLHRIRGKSAGLIERRIFRSLSGQSRTVDLPSLFRREVLSSLVACATTYIVLAPERTPLAFKADSTTAALAPGQFPVPHYRKSSSTAHPACTQVAH